MICKPCHGTGEVPPYTPFERLRLDRKRKRISLQVMAKELGVTPGHLHDMEHGRRRMSDARMELYRRGLK